MFVTKVETRNMETPKNLRRVLLVDIHVGARPFVRALGTDSLKVEPHGTWKLFKLLARVLRRFAQCRVP